MAFDIWFNGVPLSTVTPNIEQARVLTLNPQTLAQTYTKVDPPLRNGYIFVRSKLGPRSMILSVVLGSTSAQQRLDDFMAICQWAYSSEPKVFYSSHMRRFYLEAICTMYPEFKANDPNAAYEFEFTALKPEYIGKTLQTANYDENMVIGGLLDTWVDYERTLASDATSIVVTIGGKTLTIEGDIPAGTVNVYSELEKVMHTDGSGNITSLAEMLSYDSQFWKLSPGTYTPSATGGIFTWRERTI